MTDLTYRQALAYRLLDRPLLVPAEDPLWPTLMADERAWTQLITAWVRGHELLVERWGKRDVRIGALPTTLKHVDDEIVVEIAGIAVRSVSLEDLR